MTSTLQHALYLAARYLRSSPGRSLVLVAGTAVAIFLPLFTWLGVQQVERSLMARAVASPILIGSQGNELDLTLNALYFRGRVAKRITYGERAKILDRNYGTVIPLHVHHTARGAPVVGTSLDYFTARGLTVVDGRRPALLGEVVAGAAIAERLRLTPGDQLRSDASNLYDLAGAYPLLLDIVGVLAATGSPDDEALFADIKTTWALDGLLHGHREVTSDQALNAASARDVDRDGDGADAADENLEATAALFMFAELSDRTRASFHLHGQADDAPVSSLLVLPRDRRAHDQLLGDFALEQLVQAVRPRLVIASILDIVLRVRAALGVYFAVVAMTTLAFFVLVISLGLRLRRHEIELMRRIGAARSTLAAILTAEIVLVAACALLLATAATGGGLWLLGRWF